MAHRLKYLLIILAAIFVSAEGYSQSSTRSYKLSPYPDLWYNSVDGIRGGIRILGEYQGDFLQGAHRLDAGIWVASKWPDHPVSYYVSLTEPLPFWSADLNEFNITGRSSVRTGLSRHSIFLTKRIQNGFNELDHLKFKAGFIQQQHFEDAYLIFPQLWQDEWLSLINLNFFRSKEIWSGVQTIELDLSQNIASSSSNFTKLTADLRQTIHPGGNFRLGFRAFAGLVSDNVVPEYAFGLNFNDMNAWMNSGLMRARGTVPPALIEDGLFQFRGGANLRGYASMEMKNLSRGAAAVYSSVIAINTEFDYPNLIDRLWSESIIEDFLKFRTYLFFDAGQTSSDLNFQPTNVATEDQFLADAGQGFQLSVNIPDYLGNDRAIAIRYEIPFWLSDPSGNESPFRFRSIIGIGTVIDF